MKWLKKDLIIQLIKMEFKEFTQYIFDNNLEVYCRRWQRIFVKDYRTGEKKGIINVSFNQIWENIINNIWE